MCKFQILILFQMGQQYRHGEPVYAKVNRDRKPGTIPRNNYFGDDTEPHMTLDGSGGGDPQGADSWV